jgi:hypothetical protein
MDRGKGGKGKHGKKDQGGKRKHPLTPPSEDFGDSEFSEEKFSSEGEESPPSVPLSSLFEGLDDSMGLSTVERAYIRSIKWAGLEGSDDSEEDDSSEDGSSEEDSEEEDGSGNDGGDEGDSGGGKGDGGSDDSSYDGCDEGGNSKDDNGISCNIGGKVPPA